MKILVVDADPKCRKDFKNLLESKGYVVEVSTDGMAAYVRLILKRQRFHLVLTETKMPCMGGPELVEELRKRGMKIPVIGMSHDTKDGESYDHFWDKNKSRVILLALIKKLTTKSS